MPVDVSGRMIDRVRGIAGHRHLEVCGLRDAVKRQVPSIANAAAPDATILVLVKVHVGNFCTSK